MKVGILVMNRGWDLDNYVLYRQLFKLYNEVRLPPFTTLQLYMHHNTEVRDFSVERNSLMKEAEDGGCEWCFFLNTDEAIYSSDFEEALELVNILSEVYVYSIRRLTFIKDFNHIFDPARFPDWQPFFIRLGVGLKWTGNIYERILNPDEGDNFISPHCLGLPRSVLWHYAQMLTNDQTKLKWWAGSEYDIEIAARDSAVYFDGHNPLEHDMLYLQLLKEGVSNGTHS